MDGFSFMQFLKTILLGITTIVGAGCFFVPYWFKFIVMVSWDAGKTQVAQSSYMGLFYMDQGTGIDMVDLVFLDKATNAQTFPPMFRVAQIFYGVGISGMFVCFIASGIYSLRKYKSATGELCLAGGLLPVAFSLVLGVLFAVMAGLIQDENSWEAFPVPGSYVQVKAMPELELSYGIYAAAVAALLGLICLGIAWLQACSLCRHVENVRYQMLFAPLTDDERGVGSEVVYRSRQPQGFRYDGYSKPGIEVDF